MRSFKRATLASMMLVLSAESPFMYAATQDAQQSVSTSGGFKYGLTDSVSESHSDGEVVLTDLSDQVHVLQNQLRSVTAIHYYSFTAVRGQNVLLAYSDDQPHDFFKVEYLSGDKWEPLMGSSKIFSGLGAGDTVIVRVVSSTTGSYVSSPYKVVFGSSPLLKKFELKDEVGVNRIPPGHTEPSWLPTQGYTEANLEAYFTDSVGAPLKGAVGRLTLNLKPSRLKPVIEEVSSDRDGKVVKVISFERCTGGHEALDHVSYHLGTHTWRSYYYVGVYTLSNALLGMNAEVEAGQDIRSFGHICTQRLIKSVRGSM